MQRAGGRSANATRGLARMSAPVRKGSVALCAATPGVNPVQKGVEGMGPHPRDERHAEGRNILPGRGGIAPRTLREIAPDW